MHAGEPCVPISLRCCSSSWLAHEIPAEKQNFADLSSCAASRSASKRTHLRNGEDLGLSDGPVGWSSSYHPCRCLWVVRRCRGSKVTRSRQPRPQFAAVLLQFASLLVHFAGPCRKVCGRLNSYRCGDHGKSPRILLHMPAVQRPSERHQRLHSLLRRLHRERSNWGRRRYPLSGAGAATGQGSVLRRSAQLSTLHPHPPRGV